MQWNQTFLPDLHLALGNNHSWRSKLVFVYHEIQGRAQAELYADEGQRNMWWVLRGDDNRSKDALESVWGWLPLETLPSHPEAPAKWQTENSPYIG